MEFFVNVINDVNDIRRIIIEDSKSADNFNVLQFSASLIDGQGACSLDFIDKRSDGEGFNVFGCLGIIKAFEGN